MNENDVLSQQFNLDVPRKRRGVPVTYPAYPAGGYWYGGYYAGAGTIGDLTTALPHDNGQGSGQGDPGHTGDTGSGGDAGSGATGDGGSAGATGGA